MEDVHERTARAIKEARRSRSAQWLADETARLGFPMSRAALANYESGRKKGLDIAELMVIAAACDVPPVSLLFPDQPDGPVEVLPGQTVTCFTAAEWFSGSGDLPAREESPASDEATILRLSRARQERRASLPQLFTLHKRLVGEAGEGLDEWYVKQVAADRQMDAEIRAAGGVVEDAQDDEQGLRIHGES